VLDVIKMTWYNHVNIAVPENSSPNKIIVLGQYATKLEKVVKIKLLRRMEENIVYFLLGEVSLLRVPFLGTVHSIIIICLFRKKYSIVQNYSANLFFSTGLITRTLGPCPTAVRVSVLD